MSFIRHERNDMKLLPEDIFKAKSSEAFFSVIVTSEKGSEKRLIHPRYLPEIKKATKGGKRARTRRPIDKSWHSEIDRGLSSKRQQRRDRDEHRQLLKFFK